MADKSVEGRAALADCLALVACLVCAGLGAALFVASDSAGLAFHGLLLLVGSLAALGCVVEFSFDSLRRLPTGYMDGPIKVATIAAVIWGIAGFVVGDVIAWQLAFPGSEPRSALDQLRPPAPAAHLGGDLRLRRQRAARHLALRRAAHLPRALGRALGALVRRLGLPAVHRCSPAPATCSASRRARNTPSPSGTPTCG